MEEPTCIAYFKSKTIAEKAAWDFIKELPDDQKFELAVINPVFVVGPVLCGKYGLLAEYLGMLTHGLAYAIDFHHIHLLIVKCLVNLSRFDRSMIIT